MNFRSSRYRRRWSRSLGIAAAWLAWAPALQAGESGFGAGRLAIDPDLSVTFAAVGTWSNDGRSMAANTATVTLAAAIVTEDSAVDGGVFASHQASSRAAMHGNRTFGAWAKVRRGRWVTTSWLAAFGPKGSALAWHAGSNLRYELGKTGKLGIDVTSPIDDLAGTRIAAGYAASISESLTVSVFAGSDRHGDADVMARLEFNWDAF